MPYYTVKHHGYEFACPECGRPVYVGDRAWHEPGVEVYCSSVCAVAAATDAMLEAEPMKRGTE